MFFGECFVPFLGIIDLADTPEVEPRAGQNIAEAAKTLCIHAAIEGRGWGMTFNGTRTHAQPGDTPQQVFDRWARKRRR